MNLKTVRRSAATASLATAGIIALSATGVVPPAPASAAAAPSCFGRPATIVATGDGVVRGTPGDDVIVASPEARVVALEGDDRVCGPSKVDAGPGADQVRYTGDPAPYDENNPVSGSLDGGPDDDVILARYLTQIRGGRGDDRIRFFAYAEVYGNQGDDVIVQYDDPDGTDYASSVAGGPGDDRLLGGGNSDMLYGGPGRDYLDGQGSEDYLYGQGGDDQVRGGRAVDALYGGAGRDRLDGGRGADSCYPNGSEATPGPARAC